MTSKRLPAVTRPRAVPATLAEAADLAAGLARAEKADATRRAYQSDFAIFRAWCERQSTEALPASPETVAAFLASECAAGRKASTIKRRNASIRYAHRLAGLPSPTDDERVRATLRGARRTIGTAVAKKAPATAARIKAMADASGEGLAGLRDRALMLFGFGGAFRRSELVALDVADIDRTDAAGIRITIRKSKTDQEGAGDVIAIVRGNGHCPVAALDRWLEAAGIASGPVFRRIRRGGHVTAERLTDKSVANIIKAHAARVGLDPRQFAGHSLRSGFLTSAAGNGASLFKMMDVSRHRSVETLKGYVREAELFHDHAGAGLL
jgi:site-specific recombinase XerD